MAPRRGLNLQSVLKTAAELADEKGMEAVTLASLAKRLNIRTPSLYNHVNGLTDLRTKLAVHGIKRLHQTLLLAVVGRSGDDAVRALGEAYVTFARTHPGLYDATLAAPAAHDPLFTQAADEVADLVVRLLKTYGLKEETALHAVRGLRSLLHGFASLELRGGFQMPLDLDKSFHLSLDTFLAGIHSLKQKDHA